MFQGTSFRLFRNQRFKHGEMLLFAFIINFIVSLNFLNVNHHTYMFHLIDNCFQGIIPEFRISTFPNKHKDMIRQVDYCEQLHCIVSASECREIPVGQTVSPGLVLTDLGVQHKETIMRIPKVRW